MTTETAARRDTQKLQRAIVDALEDVKAQEIQVFDTAHLSALFERVIIASGTSNRQTKALAASVRDAVREAGFPKPRMEGEANGEWIIVDCARAVVHIMQPNVRQYYHLEELWGDKPVRLKFGSEKPVVLLVAKPVPKPAAKQSAGARGKFAGKAAPAKPAGKAVPAKSAGKAASGKSAGKAASGKRPAARAATAKQAPTRKPAARKS